MPNVFTLTGRFAVVAALLVLPLCIARAQQPDSAAARDTTTRRASARADSIRTDSILRAELARLRGEPRASMESAPPIDSGRPSERRASPNQVKVTAAAVSADMIADFSPRATARDAGGRIRMRDVEGAVEAAYGPRIRGLIAITLTDNGSPVGLKATDALLAVQLPLELTASDLLVGATALPFGRGAQLHRHALLMPDQPLPIRVLLGANGLRGTGVQLRTIRALGLTELSVDLAVADRFGARVDSLRPGEPADQSLAGLAAGGRVGLRFGAIGTRISLGASSISGKREQPIGCVYEGTVGPVPCPAAVNAANTRLTVLGADASASWADSALVISGEWMRMVVGATDLPAFSNDRFAPFYEGLNGTYDGGYLDGSWSLRRTMALGARGEWLQNPEVGGLNDAWAGGYVSVAPFVGARLTASYQRRLPTSLALLAMPPAERAARDRVVIRGSVVLGRHPRAGLD